MSTLLNSQVRERIFRRHAGGDLTAQQLIHLLECRVSPGALPGRNELVRRLADCRRHRNLRAHTEGSDDGTSHYTVYIDGRGYHLRVDAKGIIFQVTDNSRQDIRGYDPWRPPGSAPSRS